MPVVPLASNASVHSLEAARCRYVNSTWSRRISGYSGAIGSLTLRMRSPVAHTFSALGRIFAPAAANSPSVIDEPTPASVST